MKLYYYKTDGGEIEVITRNTIENNIKIIKD